jgi:uncharacterized membrane protein
MNLKLLLQLSLFALAMGIGTVYVIPSKIEPVFWFVIFLICAYMIAKHCPGKYFLHGVVLGLINSVWVTGSHILLFDQYVANHAKEMAMMSSSPLANSPRLMMALIGPVIGLISGLVLGLFAVVANRLVRPKQG